MTAPAPRSGSDATMAGAGGDSRTPARRVWAIARVVVALIPVGQAALLRSQAGTNFQIGMDFRLTWTIAAAWTEGRDTYDDGVLKEVWARRGLPHVTPPGLPQTPNVYPLTVAPIMAPFTRLGYEEALTLWMLLSAVCVSVLLLQLQAPASGAAAGPSIGSAGAPLAAAVLLVLSFPLHYGLSFGNLAIPASFLTIQGLIFRNRPLVGGALLGLALAKYSLSAPIVLYLLIQRRWRLVATAALVHAALFGAATLGARPDSAAWVTRMIAAGRESLRPGQINHYAGLEHTALHVELPALLCRVSPSLEPIAKPAVAALVAGLIIALARARRTEAPEGRFGLDHVAILSVTMLAFYHRAYDAVIVLYPLLYWLVRHDRAAAGLRALFAPLWTAAVLLMLPGPTFQGGRPEGGWWVTAFVQQNCTWGLLLAALTAIGGLVTAARAAARRP